MFIFIIFLLLANFNCMETCELQNNNICCDISCEQCGTCLNNPIIDKLCCELSIVKDNKSCDHFPPPCIINFHSIFEPIKEKNFIEYIKSLNIIIIVLIIIAFILAIIFLIYTCCFFGSKKPPLNYQDIIDKIE